MIPFEYVRASSLDDARVRAAAGATLLAGGTTLVDLMKLDVERPTALVDLAGLPLSELVWEADGTLAIGALVKNSTLAHDPRVIATFPVLSQALLAGASPQLRNMASVGGNVLQRTRCAYFREPTLPCNKRAPGSGCGALAGEHRNHAVLGTSDACIAPHPSDMCVALAALEAVVEITGAAGTRRVPFQEFHLLPGQTPQRENVLDPGDVITRVLVPPLAWATRGTYLKVRDRASYEFALVSAAVMLDLDEGHVRNARIALGGVGAKPWRATAAERALRGAILGRDAYRAAAEAELAGATPHRDNAFKVPLAIRALTRALEDAPVQA